jgi:nucleotide-binding universal stress UspA family protein
METGAHTAQVASTLARAHGARLYLVHADRGANPGLADATSIREEDSRYELARRLVKAREEHVAKEVDCVSLLVSGKPAEALEDLASRIAIDLMVVGPHEPDGGGHPSRVFGTTADALIRHVGTAVLVTCGFVRRSMDGLRVVAGVDFDDSSARAAEVAMALAEPFGGHLTLVHVVDPPARPDVVPEAWRSELAAAEARANKKLAAFTPAGKGAEGSAKVELERELRLGEAVEVLLGAARDKNADVLVVGTHGRSAARELFLGSVAKGLLKKASIPVLVVREEGP